MNLKSFALSLFILVAIASNAQTIVTNKNLIEPRPILLGGGIVLGGGSGSFQIGLNPELLKSYNEYVDLGIAMNIYYSSFNANEWNEYRTRNLQLGIGTFVRAWPIQNFFLQLQPEYNITMAYEKNVASGMSGTANFGAASVLAGIGYGQHSKNGMSYFSIMFDLVNDLHSPYRMGQLRAQPIFRAGVGFPINLKKLKTQ
jgi:hypothetical protein